MVLSWVGVRDVVAQTIGVWRTVWVGAAGQGAGGMATWPADDMQSNAAKRMTMVGR